MHIINKKSDNREQLRSEQGGHMAGQIKYEERTRTGFKVKEPEMYHVVMYNDDFTPMDFLFSRHF